MTAEQTKPDTTYNGWTNYETWCVNLWITNDQDDYNYWQGRAAELASLLCVHKDVLPQYVGESLKEEFADNSPVDGQANVWADLMNAALSEVN